MHSQQLEILSLFASAAKIHAFTLEVVGPSSTVAALSLQMSMQRHMLGFLLEGFRVWWRSAEKGVKQVEVEVDTSMIPLLCLLSQSDFKIYIRNYCFREEKIKESVFHGGFPNLS